MTLYLPIMKFLATCGALIIYVTNAQADTSWMKMVQPLKTGPHPKIKPMKLEYEFSWRGALKAGSLTLDFNKKDKRYKGIDISQAYGRSLNVAYGLFPYHFSMTSFVSESNQKPLLFVADEKDKRDKIKTNNTFKPTGVLHTSTKTKIRTNAESKIDHLFKFPNAHDPISAIQHIRRQPLKNGDKIYLCLHPFKSPMFSEITVLGREVHNGKACIKIDVKLQKIDKDTMALQAYTKLKKATLWLSDDADRLLMELRSQVFIGDIRAVLIKQTPL